MKFEEACQVADLALFAHTGHHLSDAQRVVLLGALQGLTYEQIASTSNYSEDYLKKDIGPKFWEQLSAALGEPVSKRNFLAALERRWRTPDAPSPFTAHPSPTLIPHSPSAFHPCTDWDSAPDVSAFFGRQDELTQLSQWIVQDRCRLVMLSGMGGMGKTALAVKLAQQMQSHFDFVIWRSLRDAPLLTDLLASLLRALTGGQPIDPPGDLKDLMSQLLGALRAYRGLILLDDAEMILRSSELAGHYREGYQNYEELLRRFAEEPHQSCFILTGREQPSRMMALAGETSPIRGFRLRGLQPEDSQQILETQGLSPSGRGAFELVHLYRGNPSALRIAATTIREIFNGDIAQFLAQGTIVIGDILSDLLDQQFERLSGLERYIVYWLAIAYQPVALSKLKANMEPFLSSLSELLTALQSLKRRSLLEQSFASGNEATFTLQPVVMKYVISQLVDQVCRDIFAVLNTQSIKKLGLLRSHILMPENPRNLNQSPQFRLIIRPILDRLYARFGDSEGVNTQLNSLRGLLQGQTPRTVGYADVNLLRLLRIEGMEPNGKSFAKTER